MVNVQRYLNSTLLGVCLLKPVIALIAGLKPANGSVYFLRLLLEFAGTGSWVFLWSRYFKQSPRVQASLGGGASASPASVQTRRRSEKQPNLKLAGYGIGLIVLSLIVYGTQSLFMNWLIVPRRSLHGWRPKSIFRKGDADWLKSAQPNVVRRRSWIGTGLPADVHIRYASSLSTQGVFGTVFLVSAVGTGIFGGALPAYLTWDKNKRTEASLRPLSQMLKLPKLNRVARIACYTIAVRSCGPSVPTPGENRHRGVVVRLRSCLCCGADGAAPMLYVMLGTNERMREGSTVLLVLSGAVIALSNLYLALVTTDLFPSRAQ